MFQPSKSFHIADLGCSTGPNTFWAVENIIEAVKFKYICEGLNSHIPKFQVFFQDLTPNDFNIFFRSLPKNKQYYAVGEPGSFYDQIFPSGSINIAYCYSAIHWLSRVPTSVTGSDIPLWKKGKIHYLNATDELLRAFETQNGEDMNSFLKARARDIVHAGSLVLTFPGRHDDTPLSDAFMNVPLNLLRYSLVGLVTKGLVSEEKIYSFSFPMYMMSTKELSDVVERNGCFSVDELMDELFDPYQKNCEDRISALVAWRFINFFAVLKRKEDYCEDLEVILQLKVSCCQE